MRCAALLAAALAGCAHDPPEAALERYRRALESRDAAQLWALSDASFRATFSPEALAEALAADPSAVATALRSVSEGTAASRETVELTQESGARITLVREGGAWRISGGGLELDAFDTPERALASFFRAVDRGRLDVVRRVIPARHAAALSDDEALRAFLEAAEGRITRARRALMPEGAGSSSRTLAGRAHIDGTRAELSYGPTRRVTLELEQGTWRVVDLE